MSVPVAVIVDVVAEVIVTSAAWTDWTWENNKVVATRALVKFNFRTQRCTSAYAVYSSQGRNINKQNRIIIYTS